MGTRAGAIDEEATVWWRSRALLVAVGTGIALFVFAAIVVLFNIGGHPGWAYNWETYTLWEGFPWWNAPSWHAFDLTDGLMTDSGRSWLIIAPAWVAFRFGDLTLGHLRLATGLISALAVPFTWLLGRVFAGAVPVAPGEDQRRFGPRAGLLAAILLPLLPSWLLYARTATLVGLSVGLAVLTVLLIAQVRKPNDRWWLWLLALQGMIVLNIWAYAPIRFLYFFAIVYFLVEIGFDRAQWRRLGIAAVVTAMTLPAVLGLVDARPGWQPITAVRSFYQARGEQFAAMRKDPESFRIYLREPQPPNATPRELEQALLKQNLGDLFKLFSDHDTKPALTDYWNNQGRLMPWFLLPFLLLGIGITLRWVLWKPELRLLHLCFWGFTLPMIATSKVHIGRLVFAIPFICIFVAIGAVWLGTKLIAAARSNDRPLPRTVSAWAWGLSALLIVATAGSAWIDYGAGIGTPREYRVGQFLAANHDRFAQAGGAVWVFGDRSGAEIEAINLATAQIAVYNDYQFVNLATGETPDPNDPRPIIYYGAVLDQLKNPAMAQTLCALPWLTPADGPPLNATTVPCMGTEVTVIS